MPQVSEPIYCSQQIIIPPTLPHILKVYAKAAIKTQPYDLLTWSAAYFRAMADGKIPPMKLRLEYPLVRTDGGLTAGYLRLIIKQFSGDNEIEREVLQKRWHGICLKDNELRQILCTAGVYKDAQFALYKFVAVAAGFLCKSLTQTMMMLCELFSDEPEGGSGAISADLFVDLYTFLAAIDASKKFKYIDGIQEGTVQNAAVIDDLKVNENETPIPNNTADIMTPDMDDTVVIDAELPLPELSPEVSLKSPTADVNDNNEDSSVKDEGPADLIETIHKDNNESDNVNDEEKSENEECVDAPKDDPGDGAATEPKKNRVVTLRVFSEEGVNIDSLSAMSIREHEGSIPPLYDANGEQISPTRTDITVKEMEAVIEQLQRNKDEKVKDLEATMDSLEDLVEKTKMMTSDVDTLSSRRLSRSTSKEFTEAEKKNGQPNKNEQNNIFSFGIGKISVDPHAKGVVNPIFKGLFDNVADKMGVGDTMQEVVDEKQPEVIIVNGIPGIGPVVDEEIVEEFLKYVRETAAEQCDMFMPRDIRHCLCPPLEKIIL